MSLLYKYIHIVTKLRCGCLSIPLLVLDLLLFFGTWLLLLRLEKSEKEAAPKDQHHTDPVHHCEIVVEPNGANENGDELAQCDDQRERQRIGQCRYGIDSHDADILCEDIEYQEEPKARKGHSGRVNGGCIEYGNVLREIA